MFACAVLVPGSPGKPSEGPSASLPEDTNLSMASSVAHAMTMSVERGPADIPKPAPPQPNEEGADQPLPSARRRIMNPAAAEEATEAPERSCVRKMSARAPRRPHTCSLRATSSASWSSLSTRSARSMICPFIEGSCWMLGGTERVASRRRCTPSAATLEPCRAAVLVPRARRCLCFSRDFFPRYMLPILVAALASSSCSSSVAMPCKSPPATGRQWYEK